MLVSNSRAAVARMVRVAVTNTTASPSLLATSSTMTRNFVAATNVVLEKHVTKVPTMGDSITEVREEMLVIHYAMNGILYFSYDTNTVFRLLKFVFNRVLS